MQFGFGRPRAAKQAAAAPALFPLAFRTANSGSALPATTIPAVPSGDWVGPQYDRARGQRTFVRVPTDAWTRRSTPPPSSCVIRTTDAVSPPRHRAKFGPRG